MIYYKTDEEIELIRTSCMLVSKTLAHVAGLIKPGAIAKNIDTEAEQFIRDHGAVPGFKGLYDFPATLCFSINENVVHGIPAENVIVKEGDVVSVDCGVINEGYYGDAAYTFAVGEVPGDVMQLLRATKTALQLGIDRAKVGNRIGDIGYAIQNFVERQHGYGVVRSLVGHGVGKSLHEDPQVPNFGKRGRGTIIRDGLVIAIEPMVNMGTRSVKQASDGWTIYARDRKPSAHYEHTIAVRKRGTSILSDHKIIEKVIAQNPELRHVDIIEEAFV